MAVGDIYEVNLEYGIHQRPLVSSMWFQVTTDSGTPENNAQDLASAVANGGNLWGLLRELVSSEVICDQIKTYLRVPSGGGQAQGPPGVFHVSSAGALTGQPMVDSTPIVIEWAQTAQSAKANGRIFLSGVREDDVDGNALEASFVAGAVATFEAAWNATLLGITGDDGGTYRQVVMSKLLALVPYLSPTYGSPLDVTSCMVNPLIKNQKRRQSRWEGAGRT